MSRPRVMHVVLSLDPGGTERLVIELCRRLHAEAPMSVCCLDREGEWAAELSSQGIRVVALGRQPGLRPGMARSIARLAADQRATVLHCHQYTPFVYGSLAGLVRPGLRIVFTEHGRLSDAPPSRRRRIVNAILGRRPECIVAVSAELRRHMAAEGFSLSRITVVHNGIDPGPPVGDAESAAARASLGLDASAFVIGSVARFDAVKSLDVLVDAFADVASRLRPARLVLVGDGPERARLEAVVAARGIGPAVVFAGMRHDARRLMAAFDLYLNTSRSEGISLTLLEAMAASRPVVATRVGGTPEIISDGTTGWLVAAGAARGVAEAIVAAAADPARRASIGAAGRARVVDAFSIERMTRAYLSAYHGDGASH